MDSVLNVHNVNDYARYQKAEVLHPNVSVIHYDELEHFRHSLNRYDVYGIFLADEVTEGLTYGVVNYDLAHHALMCVAPGQIGGKTDDEQQHSAKGWAFLFDPALLVGRELGRRMHRYTYFSYNTSEALLMNDAERETIVGIFEAVRNELRTAADDHSDNIIVAQIALLLELIGRYYSRQLASPLPMQANLLSRLESLLNHYYAEGLYRQQGLPTVRYCAQELCLSANYFGDLVRQLTGENAARTIRRYVMQRGQSFLANGHTVSETADLLGYEHPQHFTRQFKNHFGVTPTAFLAGEVSHKSQTHRSGR